ncbi:hypothetical protein [Polaribacter sp.]|uniref:hypothetical protein n=1 Tax=Polaribacter sp. TaxID=1920175 RepID=UPI003EF50803
MNFFKKIFNKSTEDKEIQKQEVSLPLDDLFVHNFLEKGGKFLYCLKEDEVYNNLMKILSENNWKEVFLLDINLQALINRNNVKITQNFQSKAPFFTTCEHLIAGDGSIMFSSNQLKSIKLAEFSENFIVFAKTSQLVKDTSEGLTGIKIHNKKDIPTNITSVKNYTTLKNDDIFSNYGYSNSKNLYLLLLEDL